MEALLSNSEEHQHHQITVLKKLNDVAFLVSFGQVAISLLKEWKKSFLFKSSCLRTGLLWRLTEKGQLGLQLPGMKVEMVHIEILVVLLIPECSFLDGTT